MNKGSNFQNRVNRTPKRLTDMTTKQSYLDSCKDENKNSKSAKTRVDNNIEINLKEQEDSSGSSTKYTVIHHMPNKQTWEIDIKSKNRLINTIEKNSIYFEH